MKGRNLNLQVGSLEIKKLEDESVINEIEAVDGVPSSARAWRYRVQSTDNWSLVLAYLVFKGRQDRRDIRTLECSDGTPEYIRRLRNGLRMSVSHDRDNGKDWVELSRAEPKPRGSEWSTLKQASEDELDLGSGFCVGSRIEELSGSFGLHEDILGESDRRGNYYCAAFPHNEHSIPILCYVATRVLALLRANQNS